VTSPSTNSDINALMEVLRRLREGGGCVRPAEAGPLDGLGLDTIYRSIDGRICLKSLVPLALKVLEAGGDPLKVSLLLTWRDFEVLVLEYLRRSGFTCAHSVRFRSRRFEIDVLAADPISRVGLAIDCKHWSPGYSKSWKLREVAGRHRLKVERLCSVCGDLRSGHQVLLEAREFVPVVITLTDAVRGFINGSFIVPIRYFRDFIHNLRYYVDLLSDGEGFVRNLCCG